MSTKRKLEFKGLTNLSDIEDQMLTDLYNYRARLQHPKLQVLFDELVEDYDATAAKVEGVMWGTGDGSDLTGAESNIIWNGKLTSAQKARALKKLRESWRRGLGFTKADEAFVGEMGIRI